jgi:hypothetical protein
MKTFQILLNGQVIATETVIRTMSASAVKVLCSRLGYPTDITVRVVVK